MATKTSKETEKTEKQDKNPAASIATLPPKLVGAIADEVAKTLVSRLPGMLPGSHNRPPAKKKKSKNKKIEYAVFLDTSAIIDGRIFDVIQLGLLNGVVVIPQSILTELKHLADSQDTVKRERGRKGLEYLDQMRKAKKIKMQVLTDEAEAAVSDKKLEVDERLIRIAKHHKGKVITCDYNLEKKANIENVTAINVNALANSLKVIAVPGEALHIKLLHPGKDITQGVGYLEDGTMIVVEEGSTDVGKTIDVVVSRVIQTATGRILFAKKI
jgi:uncharacterized protein YacL